jgi:CheY-like chemotaxis protein
MKTILLVDDEDETRITTKWFLTNFGYIVDSAPSAEEALARFDPKIHDVVVTDNSMPRMNGTEMAHVMKLRSPSTPVLMYTGLVPDDRSCVDLVIQRPAHMLALKAWINCLPREYDAGAARPGPWFTDQRSSQMCIPMSHMCFSMS